MLLACDIFKIFERISAVASSALFSRYILTFISYISDPSKCLWNNCSISVASSGMTGLQEYSEIFLTNERDLRMSFLPNLAVDFLVMRLLS